MTRKRQRTLESYTDEELKELTPQQLLQLVGRRKRKGNKTRAVPTYYKGHRYASKLEARYAVHLDALEAAGHIDHWKPHPARFRLICNGVDVGSYTPDFEVFPGPGSDGSWLVDTKGGKGTREWPFRLKVIRACFPDMDLRIVHDKEF